MRIIPLHSIAVILVFILSVSAESVGARDRERRSIGLMGGGTGIGSVMYQHATGKNFNNAVTYTAGSWAGYDITLAQQSRRYFGELYLRPVLGCGIMETLVSYRSRNSVLVGVHGIAGIEYSFNDKIFVSAEGDLHLVLFDIIVSGSNEGLGGYLPGLFLTPSVSVRYAF